MKPSHRRLVVLSAVLLALCASNALAQSAEIHSRTAEHSIRTSAPDAPAPGVRQSALPGWIAGDAGAADPSTPGIRVRSLGNSSRTGDRHLSVRLGDPGGVAAGSWAARIYYRKGNGVYLSQACREVKRDLEGSVADCVISSTRLGGVGISDVISYFVLAEDPQGELSSHPAGALAADLTALIAPPAVPHRYAIVAGVASTINVGPAETITSLTNTGGAFELINAGVLSTDVVINITGDLTGELGTVALDEWQEEGVGGYTLLIRPSGGPRTITGSNGSALIRLNGADRVTIDGSTTGATASGVGGTASLRELTLVNTSTASNAVVVAIQNGAFGAQNNTFRNLNVRGPNPTTMLAGIVVGGVTPGTSGADNDNNRIENCSVQGVLYGIYSAGGALSNPNTGTVMTMNDLSAAGADRIRRVGMLLFSDSGAQLTLNAVRVGNDEDENAIGISLGALSVTSSSAAFSGFEMTGAFVSRNRIDGVTVGPGAFNGASAAGIALSGSTGAANVIVNNMISGVNSAATAPYLAAGIWIASASGSSTRLLHNSVSMTGERGTLAAQNPSYALAITGTDPDVELRNNAFANTQTSGGGANAKSYAIGLESSTFGNLDADQNAYFSAGGNAGFFRTGSLNQGAGIDYPTLAQWAAAVANDANSLQVDPLYVSSSDLHVPANSPLIAAGTPAAGVTVDFDNEVRPTVAPSIGADDLPIAAPTITTDPGLNRRRGNPVANLTLAAVSDDGGNGAVTVTGAGTVNGVTLSNIVNTGGTVTGDVVASCTATDAAFTLTASDGTLSTNATLNINVLANIAPNQGTYGNVAVAAGAGAMATPSVAPGDNGSITGITASAPGFTGTLAVNPATGVVTINNAGPASATPYTVTVTATDNCGATASRTFLLGVSASNTAPTLATRSNINRRQGSPASSSTIATVSDDGGNGAVTVTVNGGASATVNGITVAGISNLGGTISASIVASCTATDAAFTLIASDGGLSASTTLNINALANSAPNQGNYGNVAVAAGANTTVTASLAPSDNGSITGITASAPGFTGALAVNPATGVVSISNAGPTSATPYTVTVSATDNCGATSTRNFLLGVRASNTAPTLAASSALSRRQGSPASSSTIATVTDDGGDGAVTVTVNGGASATVNGITVAGISNLGGTINASVVASCTASAAAFTLTASDGSLSTNSPLSIATNPNAVPSQGTYSNIALAAGAGTTVTPSLAPTDNGTVASITASAPGFTGTLAVNPTTGVVSITNAGPASASPYTVTVTATDNCGATSTRSFQLGVNGSGSGADLSMLKTGVLGPANPRVIQYTLVASNAGPQAVASATVSDVFPAGLTEVTWTCATSGGATCNASGSGNINETVSLPAGSSITITASARVSSAVTSNTISNTATISSAVTDPNPSNNASTATTELWMFRNGFESVTLTLMPGKQGEANRIAIPEWALDGAASAGLLLEIGPHRLLLQQRQVGPKREARLHRLEPSGRWTLGRWTPLPTNSAHFEWTQQADGELAVRLRE